MFRGFGFRVSGLGVLGLGVSGLGFLYEICLSRAQLFNGERAGFTGGVVEGLAIA